MNTIHPVFDTAPPLAQVSRFQGWKQSLKARVSASILPVLKYAARPYVGGDTIDDASCVAHRLAREGSASTLGFWDTAEHGGRQVADSYLAAIDRLAAENLDSYVSIKLPALRFDSTLTLELAAAAATRRIRLHCDSHGPDVVDRSNAMLDSMLDGFGAGWLGTTLPGRWSRSLKDADWAIARGLNVRVVKGQWPDPDDPQRDMAAGFLQVIDRLAGRAAHVAVATHDLKLASEAIGRLRAAGTSCELELLFGGRFGPLLNWARANGVATRVYVPFGEGFVPDALGLLRHNPRLIWSIVRNRLMAAVSRQ